MLRFRQHIAEQQQLLIERAEEVKALVFNLKTHIPLSKKMMIRLKGGEAPEKYGIHITSIDQLDDLLLRPDKTSVELYSCGFFSTDAIHMLNTLLVGLDTLQIPVATPSSIPKSLY